MDSTKEVSNTSACQCGLVFNHKKNLYKHLRCVHKIEPLSPKPKPQFPCCHCEKKFSCKSTLTRHIRNTHSELGDLGPARKVRLICPHDTCGEEIINYVKLRQHLSKEHDVDVEYEELTFSSIAEFEKWKDRMQLTTRSLYTKDTSMKRLQSGVSRAFFNCHRSYTFKSKGKNIRALKSLGSNKTGKACPSRLEVTITKHKDLCTVSVNYWKTHCGHKLEPGRITLSRDIRLKIADKLEEGLHFEHVLYSIASSEPDENIAERIMELRRKDMHNIIRDFNITEEYKEPMSMQSLKDLEIEETESDRESSFSCDGIQDISDHLDTDHVILKVTEQKCERGHNERTCFVLLIRE